MTEVTADRLIIPKPSDQHVRTVARRVLNNGLGAGTSTFAPGVDAWSADTVADLRRRYNDQPDLSSDTFLTKLERQLDGAPDTTILLAAELLTLHALPLTNLNQESKRDRIHTILGWMQRPVTLPSDVDEALSQGSWNGGQGAHQHIWRWLAQLVEFVDGWWQLAATRRTQALADPWAWRDVVRSTELLPSLTECLLYLAFPQHFLPIINTTHKRRIRDRFSDVTTMTGDEDRDLFEITLALQERIGHHVWYYQEPFLQQWWSDKDRSTRRAWLVRPRRPHGGEQDLVNRWRHDGFVSLAATHLGTVEPGSDRQQVAAAVEEGYQHTDYAQRLQLTTEYHVFLTRMSPDDVIATVVDGRVWVGQVIGDAEYTDSDDGRLRRPAEWSDQTFTVEELPPPLSADVDQQGAVVDLTGALDALLALVEPEADDTTPSDHPTAAQLDVEVPTLRDATPDLAGRLHIDQSFLQETLDVLQDRQQMVFYGPPGTGKTYLARALARHVTDADAIRLVQFHPSYTYEDFFEGYRPAPGTDGTMAFQLQPGPLRRIASDAREDAGRPYVLIVDEINRANLAKVFGELYYLLEYRRDPVRLQYSPEESFTLPPNVFVIGTMNTADRSIALVDAAIRRRFAFLELHPDQPPVRDLLRDWLRANHKDLDRADLLDALNRTIGAEDRDFKIGPSYLMTPDAERDGGLARIWQYSILPLLEEHYYGRMDRDQVHTRFGLQAIRARVGTATTSSSLDDASVEAATESGEDQPT